MTWSEILKRAIKVTPKMLDRLEDYINQWGKPIYMAQFISYYTQTYGQRIPHSKAVRIQAEKDSRFVFFSTGRDLKVGLRGE